jgi:SET domain-containing protein
MAGQKSKPNEDDSGIPKVELMVNMSLVTVATRDIAVGEELFLDYKGGAL